MFTTVSLRAMTEFQLSNLLIEQPTYRSKSQRGSISLPMIPTGKLVLVRRLIEEGMVVRYSNARPA
jgi:hypothetical protein